MKACFWCQGVNVLLKGTFKWYAAFHQCFSKSIEGIFDLGRMRYGPRER